MPWMTHQIRVVALVALAASFLGCRPSPTDVEVEGLVRRYNALVSDAYRAGDFRIVLPVVGADEARRLTGHIGARVDQGLTLDAQLSELTFRGIERKGDEVVVSTDERWVYADRRMGSGEPVGPEARDRYEMRYHLRKLDGRWIVDRTEFASKPETSRPVQPMQGDARSMHGWTEPTPEAGGPAATPAQAAPTDGGVR
jgi:hypothetical protein